MEQVHEQRELPTAEQYWTELASDLVSLGDMPRDDRNFKAAYRLYILATLAMAEQDSQTGSTQSNLELVNNRFHEGINNALAASDRRDELSMFLSQDLTPVQWNITLAREIGANLRMVHRQDQLPDSFLGILQAIDENKCVLLVD